MMDQIDWGCLQRMYDAGFESWYVSCADGVWYVSAVTPLGDDYISDELSLERAVDRLFERVIRG